LFEILSNKAGSFNSGVLSVRIHHETRSVDCRVRILDNKDGTYKVAYLVNNPGAYLIKILADGAHIPGSPFHLTVRPGPEPDKCSMWGSAIEPDAHLTVSKPIDFVVDTAGAGAGELSVKAVGPKGSKAKVYLKKHEGKTGIYNVKLEPVRCGKYRLTVKWSGCHIPGSPHILSVYAGSNASKCRAYGPGLCDGKVGSPGNFVIETRGAGAGTLKVWLSGVKGGYKIELKPMDNKRMLEARYNPCKPGDYLIFIKLDEKNIPGSPFRVKMLPENKQGKGKAKANADCETVVDQF
jgi:filamin